MKILNNFLKLKWQRKIQVIILLFGIWFFASEYNEIYLEQETPCQIVNAYNNLPLPDRDKTVITVENHRKMSAFSITWQTDSSDTNYEKRLYKFIEDNGYKQDSKYTNRYYKDNEYIIIQKDDNKMTVSLDTVIRGVYSGEKHNK